MKFLSFVCLYLCVLILPAQAGELVVDNFSEHDICCAMFETWRMGTVESHTLCASPQRRERFLDGLAAIGKIKVYSLEQDQTLGAFSSANMRFLPQGIYSPLSGYRVEMDHKGRITISEIK